MSGQSAQGKTAAQQTVAVPSGSSQTAGPPAPNSQDISNPAYVKWWFDPNKKKWTILDPNRGPFGFLNKAGESAIAGSENTLTRAAYAYNNTYIHLVNPVRNFIQDRYIDLYNTNDVIVGGFVDFAKTIRETFQPFSDFVGSTLGTRPNLEEDPAQAKGLGNVGTNAANNASPGLGDKINATLVGLNLQAVTNFPKQLFSSLDRLITGLDTLLSIPVNLIASIYYGYIELVRMLSRIISNIYNGVIYLFLTFLDSLIPIKEILALLNQISTLANQIGGLATAIAGVNPITQTANQIINVSSRLGGVITNPSNLIVSFLPDQVSQVLYLLRNPQQIINKILPLELTQAFAKISAMTGFGFNGNMGYGFESVLKSVLEEGVIRSVLNNFSAQYNVVAPLLAGTGNNRPESYLPVLQNGIYTPRGFQNEKERGKNPKQYSPSEAEGPAPQAANFTPVEIEGGKGPAGTIITTLPDGTRRAQLPDGSVMLYKK